MTEVFPGQILQIRKNVFNALYHIRFSDTLQMKHFTAVFVYITNRVTIRFAVVPTFKNESEDDLGNDLNKNL
jgi:hypothetical protein